MDGNNLYTVQEGDFDTRKSEKAKGKDIMKHGLLSQERGIAEANADGGDDNDEAVGDGRSKRSWDGMSYLSPTQDTNTSSLSDDSYEITDSSMESLNATGTTNNEDAALHDGGGDAGDLLAYSVDGGGDLYYSVDDTSSLSDDSYETANSSMESLNATGTTNNEDNVLYGDNLQDSDGRDDGDVGNDDDDGGFYAEILMKYVVCEV